MGYDEIKELLLETVAADEKLKKLLERIERGTATYQEAQEYAIRMGELAAGITNQYCSSFLAKKVLDLEESKRLAIETVAPMLKDSRQLVADYAVQVQQGMNERAGIGLKAARPNLTDDRAEGIAEKLAEPERLKQRSWASGDQIINFEQSAVDKTVEANADLWYSAGRQSYIVRKITGNCCKWCANLAGKYEYPFDTPKDVFRRHENCRCLVIFDDGSGKYQDVHTKKVTSGTIDSASEEFAKRRRLSESEKVGKDKTPRQREFESGLSANARDSDDIVNTITENHDAIKDYSPEEMKKMLEGKGFTVLPLSRGSLAGIRFEDGGGYKTNFGGDGIFQYHPKKGSHHGGAYYKVKNRKGGYWYDENGELIRKTKG